MTSAVLVEAWNASLALIAAAVFGVILLLIELAVVESILKGLQDPERQPECSNSKVLLPHEHLSLTDAS